MKKSIPTVRVVFTDFGDIEAEDEFIPVSEMDSYLTAVKLMAKDAWEHGTPLPRLSLAEVRAASFWPVDRGLKIGFYCAPSSSW